MCETRPSNVAPRYFSFPVHNLKENKTKRQKPQTQPACKFWDQMCQIVECLVPVSCIKIARNSYKDVNYLKNTQVLNMILIVDGAVSICHLLSM